VARLCLDENVAADVGVILESQGHDGLSIVSAPALRRIGDYDVRRIAAREGRMLVTHNAGDFTLLHRAWRRWSGDGGVTVSHAGILVLLHKLRVAPAEIASHIGELLATGWPLGNELYLFKGAQGGWVRAPEPPEPR
jgi:hypothetical protein